MIALGDDTVHEKHREAPQLAGSQANIRSVSYMRDQRMIRSTCKACMSLHVVLPSTSAGLQVNVGTLLRNPGPITPK